MSQCSSPNIPRSQGPRVTFVAVAILAVVGGGLREELVQEFAVNRHAADAAAERSDDLLARRIVRREHHRAVGEVLELHRAAAAESGDGA